MATSGRVQVTSSNGRYTHTLSASVVGQDVAANTSTVYYEYTVDSNTSYANGAWTTLHNVDFHAVVNGTDHSATPNFDFRVNKHLSAVSGYQTISHASDGSLTITLRAHAPVLPLSSYFLAVDTGTVDAFTPTPIPRASAFAVTPNPVFPDGEVLITLTRAVGTFVHDITWVSGVDSGTIGTGVGTSITWTPDPDLLDGALQVAITITVQTKTAGGVAIGSPVSYDLILKALPEYPEIGVGTPYDLRIRRGEYDSGEIVVQENIPYVDAQFVDTLSASGSLNLTVQEEIYATNLDEAVVVVDMYDGSQWLDNGFLFVLTRTEGDDVDETHAVKYTGMSYVDYLFSKNLVALDYDWPVTNPGDIIYQYITLGKGRGWGPLIERSFTQTKTTLNTPWQNTTDISATKNTPVSQILDGFVNDILVEYRSYYDRTTGKAYLDMFNPGYGSDWTVQGATPIINLATTLLWKVGDKAPVRKDFSEKLTRVTVSGDEDSTTRESAAAVNPIFGHLEGSVDAAGVTTAAKLNELGDAVLVNNGTATVERTYSYDLSSTQTPDALYPYRTFRPGDYVLAPGDDGLERVRVSQVAIKRDADGTTATITIGDLIPNGVTATARKLAQAGGGAIAGGTMLSPLPLSAAIPSAPENLDTTLDGYWDETGAPKAGIFVDWEDVITSLAGTSITVDLYEVWIREEEGSPWSLAILSSVSEGTIAPIDINLTRDLRVRGRSASGIYGEYSDIVSVVTPEPDETLGAPTNPTLDADALGTVTVTWDGEIDGNTPPLWFAYTIAEISDTEFGAYTYAGQQLQTTGDIVVSSVGPGTWWFRLVGFDTLGHRGDESDAISIVVVAPLTDTREPEAPDNVIVTSEGYWNGSSPESNIMVEWDAVTDGVDTDPIDIAMYEVWGKLSTDTTYHSMGFTADTLIILNPVSPIGATWNIQVRALGTNGIFSAFSTAEDVVIDAPDATVFPPTPPGLNTVQGLILVSWDGQLVDITDTAFPAPEYIASVDIEVSLDSGTTWTVVGFLTKGTRTQAVSGLGVGATPDVRLVAYDAIGQASDPSDEATITVIGIDGADLLANSVGANEIQAGSIDVVHVTAGFGGNLDISGNGTISIIAGQAATAQDTANTNTAAIAAQRTRYDFTSTEAVISQPGSVFQVAISNTQLEFRESGVARAYLNAGVFNAPRMASGQLVLQYHVIENDPDGTVIRRL